MWGLTDALARRLAAERGPGRRIRRPRRRHPGVVDAWLGALTSPDGVVRTATGSRHSPVGSGWHATENTEAEPVRTCFRIVPPRRP